VAILSNHSSGLESSKEIATALVDMFVAIVNFWTLAIVTLQGKSTSKY
jgi:hypothetical protein